MNISGQVPSGANSTLLWANAYEEEQGAPLWEQALVSLWFLATYIPIPMGAPIRYALCAFFLIQFMIHKDAILPVLFKAWPLFLLPALGLLSMLWSPSAAATLRYGILYVLTPFILVVMVGRMNAQTILRCLLAAGIVAVIMSIPYYTSMQGGGPFAGGKNYFAQQMLFAALLCVMTVLNKDAQTWLRVLVVPFMFLALWFMLRANSATALVFCAVGFSGLFFVRFFWVGAAGVRHLRTVFLLVMSFLVFLCAMYVLNQPFNNYLSDFLALLGKDSTFTGRTHIWQAGAAEAAKHPILGVGLEGFWQDWKGAAQSINENDFKPYGTKLTFHNSYLEVRVHLGYVGLALFLLILAWCSYRIVLQWLKNSILETSAFLVFGVIVMVSTFTESYSWGTFNTPVNLFYLGALAGFSPIRKKFVGKVPVLMTPNKSGHRLQIQPN